MLREMAEVGLAMLAGIPITALILIGCVVLSRLCDRLGGGR